MFTAILIKVSKVEQAAASFTRRHQDNKRRRPLLATFFSTDLTLQTMKLWPGVHSTRKVLQIDKTLFCFVSVTIQY